MQNVFLQLERLRRHYEVAVHTYDQVALLDLSHTLRFWTELKQQLNIIAPKFSTTLSFKTAIPAKKVLKAARGHQFVFSYMPGGVITYASNGQMASGPEMEQTNGAITIGVKMKICSGYIELGNYCMVSTDFEQPLIKALEAEDQKRCNYIQWMASEAVRVSYPTSSGVLKVVAISREMIIKRVANTLNGSHPSVTGGGEADNVFDAPIHHLLKYQMGGLPLPYFILLKIAQDILAVAPNFLGLDAPAHAT